MPNKPAAKLGPDGSCEACGQRHVTRYGNIACAGHVTTDRTVPYVKGQKRPLLDQPRPCERDPWSGLDVCGNHGAGKRTTKEAGKRRAQRSQQEALMLTLGGPVPGDPGEIIAERIAARNGHVRWLLARVQALEPEQLTWGLTKRKTAVDRGTHGTDEKPDTRRFAGTDEGDTHEAKPSVWYALYVDAADKLERLCIEAMKVGLLERQVRMDERVADMWVRTIDLLVTRLGHDPNDPATAEVVAECLELAA